jgi:hypothetical protein
MEWSDRDLELAVIDSKGTHPVAFFRVAVLRIAAGSMSKPTISFALTLDAQRTGGIGCLTKQPVWTGSMVC